MGLQINGTGDLYTTKNTNISWSGFTGTQVSYELQWKLKSSGSWNTCGQVNSSATTVSLLPIYNAAEVNGYAFKEIHYRVRVRTTANTNPTNNEVTTGDWYSEAHNLIFKPSHSDTLSYKNGNSVITIPLFTKSEVNVARQLNVKKNNSVISAPVVGNTHALSSNLKESTGSVAKANPAFAATGIGRNAYMSVNGRYLYYYFYSGTAYAYDRTYAVLNYHQSYDYYSSSTQYYTYGYYTYSYNVSGYNMPGASYNEYYTYCSGEYWKNDYSCYKVYSVGSRPAQAYYYIPAYVASGSGATRGSYESHSGPFYGYYNVYRYDYYQYSYIGEGYLPDYIQYNYGYSA